MSVEQQRLRTEQNSDVELYNFYSTATTAQLLEKQKCIAGYLDGLNDKSNRNKNIRHNMNVTELLSEIDAYTVELNQLKIESDKLEREKRTYTELSDRQRINTHLKPLNSVIGDITLIIAKHKYFISKFGYRIGTCVCCGKQYKQLKTDSDITCSKKCSKIYKSTNKK